VQNFLVDWKPDVRTLLNTLFLLLFLISSYSWGQTDYGTKKINLSGFGTLGLVHSSNQDADYVRDLLQSKGVGRTKQLDFGLDSILGLQLDYAIHDELSATAQVVSRRTHGSFKPELTWGFLRYEPNDELQVRLGQLGFDVYLQADSRNIGSSYPWVRPPIEYFGSLIISHFVGGDVVLKKTFDQGLIKAKFYSGNAQQEVSTGEVGSFFSLKGSSIQGGHAEYIDNHWHARLSYAQMRFKNEFPQLEQLAFALRSPMVQSIDPNAPLLAQQISFKDKRVQYFAMGLAYDKGPLKSQVMLSRLHSDSLGYPSNKAGYAMLAYRLGKWTPYTSFSQIKSMNAAPKLNVPLGIDPRLDVVASGFSAITRSQLADQKTLSLGVKYDLTESTDIKLQFDRIRSYESLLIRNTLPSWNGRNNLVSFTFDFVF
jgi:hypothetical protein